MSGDFAVGYCQNCGRKFYIHVSQMSDQIRANFCKRSCYEEYRYKIYQREMAQRRAYEREVRKSKYSRVLNEQTNKGVQKLGKKFLPRFGGR